jgi:Fe-S cluster assembly protein SufD
MIAVDSPSVRNPLEKAFVEAFKSSSAANVPADALTELRNQGFEDFVATGLPDIKDEAWKYTNIQKALDHPLRVGAAASIDGIDERDLAAFRIEGLGSDRIVLFDGKIVPKLTRVEAAHVSVSTLSEQWQDDGVRRYVGHFVNSQDNGFAALNTAFLRDGLVIRARSTSGESEPIHIVHLSSGTDRFVQPRILVIVDPGAELTLVESQHVMGSGRVFVNSVAEAVVGSAAKLDYCRIQDGGSKCSTVSNAYFYQEEDSHATCTTITLSGDMIRNNVVMHPDAERCESHLFGLFVGREDLHIDNHTLVDHAKPNCFSNELYKGVLDGRSTGVFNGRVLVRRDAQQTNAYQSNKSIVLSDDATMNAKPELEIYADDVKCSHGATTGRLDDEAMFYLRSRGLSEKQARTMLLLAFVRDVLENIRSTALREHIDGILQVRLAGR